MQARRASRELALILFSQLDKNLEKYKKEDFSTIVLKSVRTLVSSASDEVSHCVSQLNELKNQIIDFENILRKYDGTFAYITSVNETVGNFKRIKNGKEN